MSSLPTSTTSCEVSDAASSHRLSSSESSSWRPDGWGDLRTDWLGCISAFLSLRDLSSSFLPVCRGWRDGMRAGPPRHEEIVLSNERLAKLGDATIDIRRHVSAICMTDALSRASLALTRRLPHLTRLYCRIESSVDDAETVDMRQQRFEFPPQLTELTLALEMAGDDDGSPKRNQLVLERVLDAVSHVSALATLHLTLLEEGPFRLIPLQAIQPLARLRESLTELFIYLGVEQGDSDAFSEAHIDFFNSFDRLETLFLDGVGVWTPEALERVTDPMATRIKSVDLQRIIVDDTNAAVVGRFTSLQYFHPQLLSLRDPSFLGNLTKLTSASLECESLVDPSLLVAALANCNELTALSIEHRGITSEQLDALLPSLPRLSSLFLMRTQSLTSLAFASSAGHLAHTLKTLHLCSCTALGPDEVRHLRALTALESLLLGGSFHAPLDEDTIASMTPESAPFERDVWPHLIDFSHCD